MTGEQLVEMMKKAALIFAAGGVIICLCGSFEAPDPRSLGEWLVRYGVSGLTALFIWGLTTSRDFRRVLLGVLVWLIFTTVLVARGVNDWLAVAIGVAVGVLAAWALSRLRLRSGFSMGRSELARETGRQWQRDQETAQRAGEQPDRDR